MLKCVDVCFITQKQLVDGFKLKLNFIHSYIRFVLVQAEYYKCLMSAIFSKIYIGKLKEVKIRNKFMHQKANSQGILYRSTPGSFTHPTLFSLEWSLQIKSNPETSLSNKPGDKILTSRQLLCLLTLCLLHRSSKSFVQCMVKGYITQTHHRFSYCSPGCCCHWSGAYL